MKEREMLSELSQGGFLINHRAVTITEPQELHHQSALHLSEGTESNIIE